MKRRSFGLLGGISLAALQSGFAKAQTAIGRNTGDVSLLKTTLTPMGAERAGNADGSIPAWTGGLTTLPAGLKPNDYVPELFPDEQPVVVVDSSNLAQYSDLVAESVQSLITKYGFKLKVYPTHRTASAPQYVYDNIAANVSRAQFDPAGGRFGFVNAYGGVPFPIPDTSDPYTAGAQIIWNHELAWQGYAFKARQTGYAVSNGNASLTFINAGFYKFPYYDPNGSLSTFSGILQEYYAPYQAPADLVGQVITVWYSTNPFRKPQQTWELLNGQGRVRRAPEFQFDSPLSQYNGISNVDETFGFTGSLEKYDWKYIGKKEMFIPYNCNKLAGPPMRSLLGPQFIDPEAVRWEKHRVWVVEATLHPGERNVLARRVFHCNEDTWESAVIDEYDASGTLVKANLSYVECRPDLPGTVQLGGTVYNLQTGDYGPYLQGECLSGNTPIYVTDIPNAQFDPNNMAASAQY